MIVFQNLLKVHCRVGSLEKLRRSNSIVWYVHCRVGSLEMYNVANTGHDSVHCRVGSLEMPKRLYYHYA